MKEITLTNGYSAMIDNNDFDLVCNYHWLACSEGRTFYARARIKLTDGRVRYVAMHRLIMNADVGQEVDHIDGDGLNNQRSNLRFATRSQNSFNARLSRANSAGYKGASFCKQTGRWSAFINIQGKTIRIGRFDSPRMAAIAYDIQAIRRFGLYAKTNGKMGLLRLTKQ